MEEDMEFQKLLNAYKEQHMKNMALFHTLCGEIVSLKFNLDVIKDDWLTMVKDHREYFDRDIITKQQEVQFTQKLQQILKFMTQYNNFNENINQKHAERIIQVSYPNLTLQNDPEFINLPANIRYPKMFKLIIELEEDISRSLKDWLNPRLNERQIIQRAYNNLKKDVGKFIVSSASKENDSIQEGIEDVNDSNYLDELDKKISMLQKNLSELSEKIDLQEKNNHLVFTKILRANHENLQKERRYQRKGCLRSCF